jgi:hypothetical protein
MNLRSKSKNFEQRLWRAGAHWSAGWKPMESLVAALLVELHGKVVAEGST